MQLLQRLKLDDFLKKHQTLGREQVPWSLVSMKYWPGPNSLRNLLRPAP